MVTKEDVLQKKATEPPHSGKYVKHFEKGVYHCAGCGAPLFTSDAKYKSRDGWPSFKKPIKDAIAKKMDFSHGIIRMALSCKKCGGHLGHVFPDGPLPTLQHYCVNSLALDFKKRKT